MSNWRKLNQLCIRITDGSHFSPVGTLSGYPMLSVKDMRGNGFSYDDCKFIGEEDYLSLVKSDCKPLLNDILIAKDGSYLKHVFVIEEEQKEVILSSIGILRPNQKLVNPYYIKYYLHSDFVKREVSKKYVSGSALPRIILKNFGEIQVPYIEKNRQDKIVDVLKCLDSKIELNNRINSELEAMAKMLYDFWFVQFDFPDKNGKPYKSSGGMMIWNEELKREIPEGWDVSKMRDWIDSNKSGDWGKEEPEGNFTKKVTCIRGADINGLNGLAELKPPSRYILEKISSKILNSHDLIIEISGGSPTQSTGRIAFITDATIKRFEDPLICSNFCKPITIKNKKFLYNFVYYWKSLYDAGIFFGYEGKTSGIKNLLFDSFVSSFYTVVPDYKIADQFYNIMENIQEKKQNALAENQQLAKLRDWLLPMLMNGQVKIKEEQESLLSSTELHQSIAAEPQAEYNNK